MAGGICWITAHSSRRSSAILPEQTGDAFHQLAGAERLRDVGIRTGREAACDFLLPPPGREHEHPHIAQCRIGTQAPAHLETIDDREHDIQHDEVGPVLFGELERLSAILGREDFIACFPQRRFSIQKNWTAKTIHTSAIAMSIGHSSSAYSLPWV